MNKLIEQDRYGWICPICGHGIAPWVEYCQCQDRIHIAEAPRLPYLASMSPNEYFKSSNQTTRESCDHTVDWSPEHTIERQNKLSKMRCIMGWREWEKAQDDRWWITITETWSGRHGHSSGKWLKRRLSKARRREIKEWLHGAKHPRTAVNIESECNWKAW